MHRRYFFLLAIGSLPLFAQFGFAAGTAGASFLDIPLGAAPTGMGSAYTAMASDAYAPVWNPAGLGDLDVPEVTGTHLAYLESLSYEFLSGGLPLANGHQGIGAAVQYLGSGNIDGRDAQGSVAGGFSSTFAAYSLAYGRRLTDQLALGVTGKVITESISDAAGKAYAADLGALYHCNGRLTIGTTVTNVGTPLKLVNQKDPLPEALHIGTVLDPTADWRLSAETVYRRSGGPSLQLGAEWKYIDLLSLRTGYNTSHVTGLSTGAGVSVGLSLFFFGQEFSYAWQPYGALGNTNYFSLTFRFGTRSLRNRPQPARPDANLQSPVTPSSQVKPQSDADYDSIFEFLTEDEKKSLKRSEGNGGASQ